MNLLVAWKKVLLFGLFGAAGCLAGWIVGEPFLAANDYVAKQAGAGQGPTLISNTTPPAAPPLPSEFQERLKAAGGGKTGDIQISLIWNDTNDLDLHCEDPDRVEVYWRAKNSRSGGELDVDKNRGCQGTIDTPVENIYWARAKPGTYHFYQQCVRGPVESDYRINILQGGERKEHTGKIRKTSGADEGPKILIDQFEVKAKIEVYAPAELAIEPGGTQKVPVAVRRYAAGGPLDIKVEDLPEGVTAEPLTLTSSQDEGELVLKAASSADVGKKKVRFVAKGKDVDGAADSQMAVRGQFSLWMVLAIGFWTGLLAVGLCLALLAGQNKYLGKPLFASGRVPLVMVLLGAVAAGFASGTLGQALFYALIAIGASKVGFVIGWLLLGGLLGWGVSFFIPNLDGKKAALAGLGGGFLGALAFLIMSLAADWIGRLFGAALLGFCIGLMVAMVEVAFRRAWLEVRFSEREIITVNLGPEPVKIGGDSRSCTVWARGAVEVALRYWIRDGKVYCEDVPSKREAIVGDGDTRPAGNVTVVVRTGNAPAPAGSGPPPRPAARPALPVRPAPPVPPPVPPALPVPVAVAAPRPAPPPPPPLPAVVPKPSAAPDYDDGLPMPMSPPPPARAGTASILDIDDLYAQAAARPAPKPAPPAAKPPAPAPPAARSVAPSAPKPPAPPVPKPPAPPPAARSIAPPAPKPPGAGPAIVPKAGADACPTCGRKIAGQPGTRYCMVCDKTF